MDALINSLVINHGCVARAKSDGRLEVPRILLKQFCLNDCVYLYINNLELIISPNKICDGDCKINVTDSRVRVPAGILRKTPFIFKDIYFLSNGSYIIGRIHKDISETIEKFIKTLSSSQKYDFISMLGINLEEDMPKLILPSKQSPTMFYVIGNPYTFPAVCSDRQIFKIEEYVSGIDKYIRQLYLIPGIEIKKNLLQFGFLLVSEETKNRIQASNKLPKIILNFNPYTNFFIHSSPDFPVKEEDIKKAQQICNNPEKFIDDNFKSYFYNGNVEEINCISIETIRRSPVIS